MTATTAAPPRSRARGLVLLLRDVLIIVLVAVLVSFLVKTFLVRSFYIPSASMENTLKVNDRILVDQLTPAFGGYHRGDVVVFRDPGGWLPASEEEEHSVVQDAVENVLSAVGILPTGGEEHLVKRLIGLPGDRVECCNALGQLSVNGVPVDERSYVQFAPGESAASGMPFSVDVPEGHLWVLGDNRYRSQDSRFYQDQPGRGFVPMEQLVGRAFLRIWPFDRFGPVPDHHERYLGVDQDDDE